MRESKILNEFEYEAFKIFSVRHTPITQNQYLIKVDLLKEFVNGKDLIDVDKNDCENFMNYISNIYTKATCEKVYGYLHSFYNFLKREKYIKVNPFRYVKRPTTSKLRTQKDIFTIDEIDLIIRNIAKEKVRDKALIVFLITTGCMVNEILNIRWNDLTYYEEEVTIRIGKNKASRIIKLHPLCVYLLNEYRLHKEIENIYSDELIFTTQKQNAITDRNIRFIVRRILDNSGFKTHSSKDFRHSFAAISLRLGANDESLMHQLGWRRTINISKYKYVLNFVGDNFEDKESSEFYILNKN